MFEAFGSGVDIRRRLRTSSIASVIGSSTPPIGGALLPLFCARSFARFI
jgi:hypothetical protein